MARNTKPIVQKDTPVLRQVAQPIPVGDILSPAIQTIIAEMFAALETQEDGAALAAPQIGYNLRIFVVSKTLFGSHETARYKTAEHRYVFINPEIIKLSRSKKLLDEGCLSVRGWYGTVQRSERATVRAYDEQGQLFERGASGLLAQVFQHEVDHLNGTLFIDHAQELWEVDMASVGKDS
jgi:peptide deformylase